MKILGLIGGIAPPSTIEYYRHIIERFRDEKGETRYPQVIINSIDLDTAVRLTENKHWSELVDFLVDELSRLSRAGAELGAFAANTPHIVFDAVQERCSLPLVSIVEATVEKAKRRGFRKVGLFGTGFTMEAGFYEEMFRRSGISLVVPTKEERDLIHARYFGELVKGQFLPETRAQLEEIGRSLVKREGIEALVLGGTELPLLLRDDKAVGVPYLDTTKIHVDAIVARMQAG